MSKSVKLPTTTIKFEGVFDWPGLYKLMFDWMEERGFETHDKTYKHSAGPLGPEEEHIIYGESKETEYVMFKISLDVHTWKVQKAEVMKDGKKQKLNTALIRIRISPEIIYDYQGKFEETSFLEKVREFYHKHVFIEEDMGLIQDKLYYMTYKFHEAIKEYLGLYSQENAWDKKYW